MKKTLKDFVSVVWLSIFAASCFMYAILILKEPTLTTGDYIRAFLTILIGVVDLVYSIRELSKKDFDERLEEVKEEWKENYDGE